MGMLEEPTRDERMQRHIRDSAVHMAMGTHANALKGEIGQRLVNEIAQLAVHNALTQYAATVKMDIARIESFERMLMEEATLRPSSLTLGAIVRMADR